MRATIILLGVLAVPGVVRAEDVVGLGAAVGAGGQGTATYGAVELRLDAEWHGARLGLAARGVWLDGDFRGSDWAHPTDALRLVRYLELHTQPRSGTTGTTAALAMGGLAPAMLAQVASGYRAALDDRARTGIRARVATRGFEAAAEIDDLIAPALIGGAGSYALGSRWVVEVATAVDPMAPRGGRQGTIGAVELAVARRWAPRDRRAELGAGLVLEPGFGAAAVAFSSVAVERNGARWGGTVDVRAGTGSLGAAFGPLYRLERRALWAHAEVGAGAGASATVTSPNGWLAASLRLRPGDHGHVIGAVAAGAPMGRYLQAGGWAAASWRTAAGAAELRVSWARRLSSSLQVARMYDTDAMTPAAAWSVTAWFGASSD